MAHILGDFCFCWFDHIPTAKMPFAGGKKTKPRNDGTIKSNGNTQYLHFFCKLLIT